MREESDSREKERALSGFVEFLEGGKELQTVACRFLILLYLFIIIFFCFSSHQVFFYNLLFLLLLALNYMPQHFGPLC